MERTGNCFLKQNWPYISEGELLGLLMCIATRMADWLDDIQQKQTRKICGNKMPTRCNRGFDWRSYCLLNMFRAPLCPSSGAQEYCIVVAACGIWCCGFQVVSLVWSWGLCVRFVGCCFSSIVFRLLVFDYPNSHACKTYWDLYLQHQIYTWCGRKLIKLIFF